MPWLVRHPAVAAFLLALAVYLALPTRNYYWDGIGFAMEIEKAAHEPYPLLAPNHLVYAPVGYGVHTVARAWGLAERSLFTLQMLNSVLGAASVGLVCVALRRRGATARVSLWLALLFAFSATWWKFATDADAYIPSVFFLLLAWLALPRRPILAALAHTAAMLFHQLAVLFFPVAVVALLAPGRARIETARYAVLTAGLTGAAYLWAYRSLPVLHARGTFWEWVTYHSPDSAFSFDVGRNAARTLQGHVRLWVGGKLGAAQWDVIGWCACGALVALLMWAVVRRRELWGRLREVAGVLPAVMRSVEALPLLVWAGVYLLFLFFWLPQNTFYRLFPLPAFVLLLGVVATRLPVRAGAGVLPVTVGLVALWNFTFFIYPNSRVESNETLRFALAQREVWPGGTRVVFRTFHPDLWTISYFNPQAAWVSWQEGGVESLEHYRQEAAIAGRDLWLEAIAYEQAATLPEGAAWLARHVDAASELRFRSEKREFRFYRVR